MEILTRGEDSSGGYDAELTLILFDQAGRPFPWQATGKFDDDERGILQVVSSTSGKHASVLVPTKEGIAGPDASLAFQLYTFFPSTATKIVGKSLKINWPLFQNPTPEIIKHQQASSLSFNNTIEAKGAHLSGSENTKFTANTTLSLDNGQQVQPPAIIVNDMTDGARNINFDPMPNDIAQIVKDKSEVRTMGASCDEEECRPFVMIATP